MTDDRAKTTRTLLLADHLWEAFAAMAVEMGSDREALINQALYTFARVNGFLAQGEVKQMAPVAPAQESGRPRTQPLPPTLVAVPDDRDAARSHGNSDRVAEIAQQLAGSDMPSRHGSAPPPPVAGRVGPALVEAGGALLADQAQVTTMDLPVLSAALEAIASPLRASGMVAAHPGDTGAIISGARTLVLLADGRELNRVVKERFLIGRGKHCDLIINSGKVSREHAVIIRDGQSWFIEDLGSSNGTWFDKRRINRRQIQDGDEYFICSERLSCTFR